MENEASIPEEQPAETVAASAPDAANAPAETPEATAAPAGNDRAEAEETARNVAYRRLIASARAAKAAYPDFDLRRELGSRRFAALVSGGLDARTAYESVHFRELTMRALALGFRRGVEKASAARAWRPAENGLDGRATAVERPDPHALTPEMREEIRTRVRRGERVVF